MVPRRVLRVLARRVLKQRFGEELDALGEGRVEWDAGGLLVGFGFGFGVVREFGVRGWGEEGEPL